MNTYIIGHLKPDTDAVVSAMALAYLYNQKDCFGYSQPIASITDPLNPETSFLFDKFGVAAPQLVSAKDLNTDDQVILVDHNEISQRLENLNEDQITEIVDHHKVNLNVSKPIFLTFKPWGSSCTIIYHLMKTNDVQPDKKLASLMLAAILSDTVGYKGATTTDKDREVGTELAKIAKIDDVESFALEIFKAKSDVSKLTDEQIIKNDYKIFDFGGKKVFIDQLETVEQDVVLSEKKESLLIAMQQVKESEEVDLLFVIVTDVLKVNSKLLILSEKEAQIAKAAFGGQAEDQILDIGPKMSRKKEIAPAIEKAFS